jgi:hypothetical protein
VFKEAWERLRDFCLRLWTAWKKPPAPEALIEEKLPHASDEQVTRIKRRLQKRRARQRNVRHKR